MKKKASSKCPTQSWLNAKICLPEGKRGIVISQIIDSEKHGLLLQIGPDPVLSSLLQSSLEKERAEEKLKNLPRGTFVLMASHKLLGNKFWVVKTDKFVEGISLAEEKADHVNQKKINGVVTYTVREFKELKNFIEVRKEDRTTFSVPVRVLDQENNKNNKNNGNGTLSRELLTYDISQNGLSLFLNKDEAANFEFELRKEYLLELQLHESSEIGALRYLCVQKKEDHITNSYVYGFSLNQEDALNEKVQYNLSFLTWSGIDAYRG